MFSTGQYPDLLVGLGTADDAAVYRLNHEQAIVSTVDFFPPVVDDPYDFGSIVAANAMSDVYAMGGEVLFTINIVAFPDTLDMEILGEILRGGAEKVAEAGAVVVGGHSVNDKEPKYGMAVTGIIRPDSIRRKGGAQPGDVLVLTKALGIGVITTALKGEVASPEYVAAAVESMKRLNKKAARSALALGAKAMTDITGFGLLGHSHEMATQGSVDFRFQQSSLPWLPGTLGLAQAGFFPGGTANNANYFGQWVHFDKDIDQVYQDMLFTPETSGGLLVALSPDDATEFIQRNPSSSIIGEVIEGDGRIWVNY